MTTTQVYIGIGSNVDRENKIRACINELKTLYGEPETHLAFLHPVFFVIS